MTEAGFTLFGALHWAILVSIAFVTWLCVALYRAAPSRRIDWSISACLASMLIGSKLVEVVAIWSAGRLTLQNGLQMHLCDWSVFLVALLLFFRMPLLYELLYFWAVTGVSQALLTPDHSFLFSSWRMGAFFVSHGATLVGVLYLTFAHGMRPTASSIPKAFALTQVYVLSAALVDWLLICNYGYLRTKPESASLFDYLGPWPWYILAAEVVVFTLFTLAYLPYAWLDWRAERRNAPPPIQIQDTEFEKTI